MKLLLVEDDFDLAGALSRSLVARGFEVLCCADGKEALAAARRTAFDVIQNSTDHSDLDRQIAHAVVEAGAGLAMQPPAAIAGLGLHLSRKLAEMLDGEIVFSSASGQGQT